MLQCSWIKNIKFHSCLQPSIRQMKNVPALYKEIIKNWAKHFSCSLYLPSAILCKFFWFNSDIRTDNKGIFISCFASKRFYFVGQIFHDNAKTKSSDCIKSKYNLERKLISIDISWYQWIQFTVCLLKFWKHRILNCRENLMDISIFDLHLIKKANYTAWTS